VLRDGRKNSALLLSSHEKIRYPLQLSITFIYYNTVHDIFI
jgi:hypothetical protein